MPFSAIRAFLASKLSRSSPSLKLPALGPGHRFASIAVASSIALREKSLFPAMLFFSVGAAPAIGDGHDEQSLAPHGVAGRGRAEYSCRNAVAQSLQCRDEGVELLGGIPRHVLADDKIRPALLGDAADLGSEEPLSARACALPGDAVVLARVSRSEDIHDATPRSAVEGGKVAPDRRRMKPPRFHRSAQACGGSGFPLHVADAAASLSPMMEGEHDAELESADAGA
jgi:hypothetical protein